MPTTDRDDWLEKRRPLIGASDVAGILGLSPFASPFSVWADKTMGHETAENESMRFGRLLEDVVVDEFTSSKGLYVACRNQLVHHPEHTWMGATVDGLAFESPTGPDKFTDYADALGNVQVKTDGGWSKWDELPDHIQLQVTWEMFVTGYEHTWIPVLHGGRRFEVYEVEFDKALADTVVERVSEWRDRFIVGDEVPEPDGAPATVDAVKGLWPSADEGEAIELSQSEQADLDALRAVKLEQKRIEKERARLEGRIKVALQEASVGLVGGVKAVSWPEIHTERLDGKRLEAERPDIYQKYLKPSSYRRFNTH